jgi:NADH dehydrogenase FAD-containing subunit
LTIQKLILLGAGQAHLHMIQSWKASRRADTDLVLISPYPDVVSGDMLSGVVAGLYREDDAVISLPSLLQGSGAGYMQAACTHIHPHDKKLHLSTGEVLSYTTLSIDTGTVMDRQMLDVHMPGARANAVFVQPLEGFLQLWPRLLAHAQTSSMQMAVVGADAMGIELALALQHRLPHCRVTLISGSAPPAANYPVAVQKRVLLALKKANITVLQDQCISMQAGCLQLHSGASLSCDIPFVTTGSTAAPWLASSGLTLDTDGYVVVNRFLQSVSHPEVFATGGVARRQDAPHTQHSEHGASTVLQANLRASLATRAGGKALKAHRPAPRSLNFIACAGQSAIANWGPIASGGSGWMGALAWRWKNVINQRWIRQYQMPHPEAESTQLLLDSTQAAKLNAE